MMYDFSQDADVPLLPHREPEHVVDVVDVPAEDTRLQPRGWMASRRRQSR